VPAVYCDYSIYISVQVYTLKPESQVNIGKSL
jgi:hypothetical protein